MFAKLQLQHELLSCSRWCSPSKGTWRTITTRSRKGWEPQKNRSTEGSFVFLKNFSISLFFLFISYTRFHPRTLLTQGMNLRPLSQVSSSLRVMRQTGSAVFIPRWDCQDLVDSGPQRGASNSIFWRNQRTRYSQGQGQPAGEEGRVATRLWDNYIPIINAASADGVMYSNSVHLGQTWDDSSFLLWNSSNVL